MLFLCQLKDKKRLFVPYRKFLVGYNCIPKFNKISKGQFISKSTTKLVKRLI